MLGEGAETRAAQQPVCQVPPDRHARPTIPLVRSQCGRRGARSLELRTCVHVWMVGRIPHTTVTVQSVTRTLQAPHVRGHRGTLTHHLGQAPGRGWGERS